MILILRILIQNLWLLFILSWLLLWWRWYWYWWFRFWWFRFRIRILNQGCVLVKWVWVSRKALIFMIILMMMIIILIVIIQIQIQIQILLPESGVCAGACVWSCWFSFFSRVHSWIILSDCIPRSSPECTPGSSCQSVYLVLLQSALLDHFVALFLEGDDDEGHEDVDEEEGEDYEVDHVEDRHFHAVAPARTHVLLRHVRGVLEDSGGGERQHGNQHLCVNKAFGGDFI